MFIILSIVLFLLFLAVIVHASYRETMRRAMTQRPVTLGRRWYESTQFVAGMRPEPIPNPMRRWYDRLTVRGSMA